MIRIIASAIAGLLALLTLLFVLQVYGFVSLSFFAPKIVAVQSQVFHESQLYIESPVKLSSVN